jgi:hypothetical protein
MSDTIVRSWADERVAEGEARGTLRTLRKTLRDLLTDRFQSVPEELVRQIDTCNEPARLETAIRQVYRVAGLEQFQL